MGYSYSGERSVYATLGTKPTQRDWVHRNRFPNNFLASLASFYCIVWGVADYAHYHFWQRHPLVATPLYAAILTGLVWFFYRRYHADWVREKTRRLEEETARLQLPPERRPPTPRPLNPVRKAMVYLYAAWAIASILGTILALILKR